MLVAPILYHIEFVDYAVLFNNTFWAIISGMILPNEVLHIKEYTIWVFYVNPWDPTRIRTNDGSIQNDIGLIIPKDCSDSSTRGILPAVKVSNVLVVDVASTIWVKFFINIIYINCVKLHHTSPNIQEKQLQSLYFYVYRALVYIP